MSEYERTIEVNAPITHVYKICINFFEGLGYSLKNTAAPTFIEFKKGGTIWTTDEIDAPHRLSLYLSSYGDKVQITLNFYSSIGFGNFTRRSIYTIEKMINSLVTMINQKKQLYPKRICPYCKKEIPWDAQICPYCGKKLPN